MIAGVVHLTSKTKYGMTSRNVPMYLFRPLNPKQPLFIVGCSQPNLYVNLLALVEPMDMSQRIPRGNIVQVLGPCGDWNVERKAIQWTHRPHKPPKIEGALKVPSEKGRLDLRGFQTLHVDPPGCVDVDDCVTFLDNGFVVTIADVGAWVAANPALETFATQGETLYEGGRAVRPLFPIELSEGTFSLLPGEDRFGVSIVYENGKAPYWTRSIVRVTESYTYDDVVDMRELKLAAQCAKGKILGDDPHEWIEALMVSYNAFMAEELIARSKGLFRGHSEPNAERMQNYKRVCPEASRLAESAAVYQSFTDRTPHWGLDLEAYAHTTSPIRRWADVHNQMVLFGLDPPEPTESLNALNKATKKYERDLFFLTQLQTPRVMVGTVLEVLAEKSKVWVTDWQRTVTVRTTEFEVGTQVVLDYYLDMNQPTWKTRMVIRATRADTNCPESQSLVPVPL
jgi:exoribonuclease R